MNNHSDSAAVIESPNDSDILDVANKPSRAAQVDAWWRAANYLAVGQIYLLANPLLSRPLQISDVKPRLLGHWGTSPGLNFIYAHLNRIISERNPV